MPVCACVWLVCVASKSSMGSGTDGVRFPDRREQPAQSLLAQMVAVVKQLGWQAGSRRVVGPYHRQALPPGEIADARFDCLELVAGGLRDPRVDGGMIGRQHEPDLAAFFPGALHPQLEITPQIFVDPG